MRIRKMISVAIAGMIFFSLFAAMSSFNIVAEDTGPRPIMDLTSAPSGVYRDRAWKGKDQYAIVVGNDTAGKGSVYNYRSDLDVWSDLGGNPGDIYHGVARTNPSFWVDWMESGINGWETWNWSSTGDASNVMDLGFNENGGDYALDESDYNNHGTLMPDATGGNAPAWTLPGMLVSGLTYDGIDDWVNVSDDPTLNLGKNFTVSAWVKTTSNAQKNIISKGDIGVNDQSWYMELNTNKLRFSLQSGSGDFRYKDSTLAINDGGWHHVAAVIDNGFDVGNIKLYIDGQEDTGTTSSLGNINTNVLNDKSVYVGGRMSSGNLFGPWDGMIDEVKLLTRAMSPEEVDGYYTELAQLAGIWFIVEGTGDTAYDYSQYGNNGILMPTFPTDAPVWVSGRSDNALWFDGSNDYVDCGNDTSLQITGNMTAITWIMMDSIVDDSDIFQWGVDGEAEANNVLYTLRLKPGGDLYYLHESGSGVNHDATFDTNLNTGEWYHISLTRDVFNKQVRLFVNGQQVGSTFNYTDDPTGGSDGPFIMGKSNAIIPNYYFHGRIDDFLLLDRWLPGSGMWQNYNSSFTPSWEQVNPSTLPDAGSGTAHGSANSGSKCWWFGNTTSGDHNNGERVYSSLLTPYSYLPTLSNFGVLAFEHWFEVEADRVGMDRMMVSIRNQTGDTSWNQIGYWDSDSIPVTDWNQEIIDITSWIGNSIQINFTFDSVDGWNNHYAGWHIDDAILFTNDLFVIVGEDGGGGSSVYRTDGWSPIASMAGLGNITLLDVAAGPIGTTFMTVGENGVVKWWNSTDWVDITGASATDTLTGIDSTDTHYYIVGYDQTSSAVGYYITRAELLTGKFQLHPILDGPDYKINAIDWNSQTYTSRGWGVGGLAAENGNVLSIGNPEVWRKSSNIGPVPRQGHAMSYDTSNEVTVLFGGIGSSNFNDTWTYHTPTNSWSNRSPASPPPARRYHAMAYDSTNNKVVLFGGIGGAPLGDTWIYDVALNTWDNPTPASPPPARYGHSMAYDSENNKIVLFGGYNGGDLGDTWTYNVSANTWTNENPASPPSARDSHAMAYDSQEGKVVLFGGSDGASNGETWTYDTGTNTWANKSPGGAPSARYYHAMAYDSASEKIVLYGGYDGIDKFDDAWTYDATANTWTDTDPAARPRARMYHSMVYDDTNMKMVMFGGDIDIRTNDTWKGDFSSAWLDEVSGTDGENFTAVDWSPDGQDALIVGNNISTGDGVLYTYHAGDEHVSKVPDYGLDLKGHELYGVAYKAPITDQSGVALVVGGSVIKVWTNAFNDDATLSVVVDQPNIGSTDMWKTSDAVQTSTLNTQVDAGDTYTFYIDLNYSVGGADRFWDSDDNIRLEIQAWYDEGKTSANSDPEGSWATTENRTRQFMMTWEEGASAVPAQGSANMDYPITSPGTDEFRLDSWWVDPNTYGAGNDLHRLYFNITFDNQTRAADGGGFANGPPIDPEDKTDALNDPDSWDLRFRVFDFNFPTSENFTYDEFGIFRSTNISVSGNPSGSVPPGTNGYALSPYSFINYSANIPYYLNASITDLARFGGGGIISATNVSANLTSILANNTNSEMNGTAQYMQGVDIEVGVWGNSSLAVQYWTLPAPMNGTTAHGPWGSDYNNFGPTQIQWYIDVPAGTPEGMYEATITFTIGYY